MNKKVFQASFRELSKALSKPSRVGRKTDDGFVDSPKYFLCNICGGENKKSPDKIKHSAKCKFARLMRVGKDVEAQTVLVLDIANSSYEYDGGGWNRCCFCDKDAWCRDGNSSSNFVDKVSHQKDCPQAMAWKMVEKFKLNPPPTPQRMTTD